jgi:Tol biopolymer transport system component
MAKSTLLTALAIATALIGGCSEGSPTGPAPYVGKEMIVVAVKDTVSGIYADRVMTIDPKDSLDRTPRHVAGLDSVKLITSPSGGKMAFLVEAPGNESKIMVADIDGRNLTRIDMTTSFDRALSYPSLSPDGKKVVYATLDGRLLIRNIDGTGADILSTNAAFETIAAFNSDGGRIAFHGDDEKLYVVNSDGSNLRAVADRAQCDGEGLARIEWSPDGRKLVYVGKSSIGQPDIYVVNVDGASQPVQLTNDLENDLLPTWSPDGARIAWSSFPGDIYVMNADGSGRINLTPTGIYIDSYPVWSPDGMRLIYSSRFPDSSVEVGTLRLYDFRSGETSSIAFKATRGFWGKF